MQSTEAECHIDWMHPDDIAEVLSRSMSELDALKALATPVIQRNLKSFKLLGDIQYPYTCYAVSGQSERACKLTAPSDLPADIRGIYLIDYGLNNVYSTDATLGVGVQACVYSHFGRSGTATVSGMSAMRFNTTRPNTPNSQHNFGRAFDMKLQGRMKSNGAAYDQMACAYLCLYCVDAGATRVYFSDQAVVDAVNKATGKSICSNIPAHENHVHMDCR
jgi:hypothetical protein